MNDLNENTGPNNAQAPSNAAAKKDVYLVFQGGGAKGITHIGALSAVNKLQLKILGISGTSAGAIIAALAAVGYTGDELVDPEKGKHLLQLFGGRLGISKASDLFTRGGWKAIKTIRWFGKLSDKISPMFRMLIGAFAIILPIVLMQYLPGAAIALYIIFLATLCAVLFYTIHGITTVERVRLFVDKCIKLKLQLSADNISFKDAADKGALPLKIVATNVRDECLELFCLERTPRVSIADAVAASICLPIIFRCWEFVFKRGLESEVEVHGKFLDGGVVSNLPAWSFDEERAGMPNAVTIAFSMTTVALRAKAIARHWLTALINAVVTGTNELHLRGVARLVHLQLESGLGTLDFDAPESDIYHTVKNAYDAVVLRLTEELFTYPGLMRLVTKELHAGISEVLNRSLGLWYAKGDEGHLRVAVALQRNDSHLYFDLEYLATDPTYSTPLPSRLSRTLSLAGEAWLTRSLYWADLTDPEIRSFRIWDDSRWLLCVPVFLTEQLVDQRPLVIVVESGFKVNYSLNEAERSFNDFVNEIANYIDEYASDYQLGEIAQRTKSWL